MSDMRRAVEAAFRQESGQVLAVLVGWLGDLELAQDALQDALLSALEHWPADGLPAKPGAWLTTAARRKALDRIRRDPKNFDGRPVAGVNRADGLKLLFADDSWVLLRLSGTEPVVRCYCEAHSEKDTQALVEAAKRFILE